MEKNKVIDEVLGETPALAVSDLYSADFKTVFRGFDKQRVQGFLAQVADAFEVLQREAIQLRGQNAELREQVATYREMEKALTEALASAQQVGETTLEHARREADIIREEARLILRDAEARAEVLPNELREQIAILRAERAHLKSDLRAVLDIHSALLNDDGSSGGDAVEFMPGERHNRLEDSRSAEARSTQSEGDNP